MIDWAEEAVEFLKDYHAKNRDLMDGFAAFPCNHLSLVRKDGALDFYHGALRAVDADGKRILDDVDYRDYLKYIGEEVRTWSYMKFPYLKSLGKAEGWYRVGPLARLNVCDFIPTPRAQKQFEVFRAYTGGKPNNMSLHMHWARLIELLHSGEVIKSLLLDPDLQKTELVRKGKKRGEGVGLIEAPAGDAVPPLPGGRKRPDLHGQPHRLDDEQQRADEPGGRTGWPKRHQREDGDHRGHAQPGRDRHPGV